MNNIENTLCSTGYIEVVGNNIMYIDNYKRIAEYTCDCIRIVCKNKMIIIKGNDLKIDYYSINDMKITGEFNEILFV